MMVGAASRAPAGRTHEASARQNRRAFLRSSAGLSVVAMLPTIYPSREYADAGGLFAHGADVVDLHHRAAGYVDKILRGAKPTDLTIQQPTTYELVVNQRALLALGLTIPPSMAPLVTEWVQ